MLGIRTGERNPWIRTFLMAGLVLLAIFFLKPVSAAADFPLEVTMDANGGVFTRYELSSGQHVPTDVKVATLTVSKDGAYYHFDLGDYAAPVCEGKAFMGWSASKDKSSTLYSHYSGYNGGAIDFPIDGSVTKLYAVWGNNISLKLHANGGKFPDGSDIREVDVSWCKLEPGTTYTIYRNGSWADPTNTDGHLLGWSTDPKAVIPEYGSVLDLDALKSNELYAIWADVVKVTLHANGVGRFGTRTEGGVTKDIVSINARLYYDFMLKKKTVWDSNKTTMENVDESKLLLGWYASDDYTKLYATDLSDLPIDEHTPDELYAAWVDRDVSKLSCSKIADQEATGEPVVPEVEVYHRYKKLVQGTDYTVTCTNNTEPGTAKVIVSGTGDYTGKIETSFIITKPANKPEPEPEPQPEHVHSLIKHDKVEATEDAEGTEAYWECAGCGKLFSDKDGKNEIDKPVIIPKLEPQYKDKVEAFVARCYQLILNREPDEGGLQGWSESLKSKTAAAAQIINGFVSSPEYINRDLGDAESVDILYKTMLDRPADKDGKAGWVDALGKGYTLQHIINGFCASDEFTALCKDFGIEPGIVNVNPVNPVNPEPAPDTPRGKIEAFVKRCYQLILNRDADQDGLQGWSDALDSGASQACQIIDGFVRSPEYVNRNLGYAESVDILYQTMLNRAADAGGKAGWVDALEKGYTLQHIINGFCGSAEFTNICNEFGITAGNLLVQGVLVKREAITPEGEEEAPVVYVNYISEYTDEEKVRVFVDHCYEAVFGREGDAEGVEAWTRLILDGKKTPKRVAYEFIFSAEFQNNLPGNEAFIRILYRLYLNREPDADGLAGWVQMLENGTSLEEIVNSFAASEEFRTILQRMK